MCRLPNTPNDENLYQTLTTLKSEGPRDTLLGQGTFTTSLKMKTCFQVHMPHNTTLEMTIEDRTVFKISETVQALRQ